MYYCTEKITVHVYNECLGFGHVSFIYMCLFSDLTLIKLYLHVICHHCEIWFIESQVHAIQRNILRHNKSLNKVIFTYAFLLLKHIKHIREYFVQCCQLFIPFQMLCYWYITVYQMSNKFYFGIRCLLFHVALVVLLAIFQYIMDRILCSNADYHFIMQYFPFFLYLKPNDRNSSRSRWSLTSLH